MIQPQSFPIPFAKGLDQKTDPKQVQIGSFLSLQNTVFQKGGLLQKRNGFGLLTNLPTGTYNYLSTFNDNLTAVGTSIAAYSQSLDQWFSKGTTNPVEVGTPVPLIRNNFNQTQADTAISNGLVLTVYTEEQDGSAVFLYAIADATTGQNIVKPSSLPVISGGVIADSSRAFVVGNFFVVVTPVDVSGTYSLQYFSIPVSSPNTISLAKKVTSQVYSKISTNPGWDAITSGDGNTLVVAYNTTTGAQAVNVATLTVGQISAQATSATIHAFTGSTNKAAILSICADYTASPNIYYISFWNETTNGAYTAAVTIGFGSIAVVFTPQATYTTSPVVNLSSGAVNGQCLVFGEMASVYGYDHSIPSNYINSISVSNTGTVGSPFTCVRSVGLASKSFVIGSDIYFLSAYQSPFQPTYFLINGSLTNETGAYVIAKLAYENGGGYVSLGLPGVTLTNGIAQCPYLYKDLIEALNTLGNPQQTTAGGIYSQTGINLASFTIGSESTDTTEIGNNLNISGGFGWMYDGYLPVEQNFFLWPDSVECAYTETSTVTPTGTASNGAFTIVVSDATGIYVGMTIADSTNSSYIPSGTTITKVSGTTLTMSAAATHAISGDTLSIQGNLPAKPDGSTNTNAYFYQAIYSWTDNQGNAFRSAPSIPVSVTTAGSGTAGLVLVNIPTLRLTYKIASPVKISIYRWSVANQNYYEITSITNPLLNDPTIDSVTYADSVPDADIIGNNLIYTTGGVVEDVNPPAYHLTTLADTRQWIVDDEDPNLLWYSKQVIEGTPVEFSDLFTIYVPPTTAAQGSTGQITALAPMDGNLILFKKNAIYYINVSGGGPDNTGANSQYSQAIFITSVVGCSNQQSIVFMPNGLMFQSEQGIWLLDRSLQVSYLGAPVENFNNSIVESALNIPATTQVRFTLNTGQTLMYDYYYNQWGTFVGAPGLSSCIYENLHTFINSSGQVYQETPGLYLDGSNPVLIEFLTGWIQLQGISGFQRLWEFQLLGSYISPHLLDVKLGYDFGALSEQAIIQPTNFAGVYGSDSLYGQTSPFGGPGSLEQWRVQPATEQCQAFQISLQELFDPSFGGIAGAGFTLSAITCVLGLNKSYRPVKAANTVGTQ